MGQVRAGLLWGMTYIVGQYWDMIHFPQGHLTSNVTEPCPESFAANSSNEHQEGEAIDNQNAFEFSHADEVLHAGAFETAPSCASSVRSIVNLGDDIVGGSFIVPMELQRLGPRLPKYKHKHAGLFFKK